VFLGSMLENVHRGDFRAARFEQELFVSYLEIASTQAASLGQDPTFDELATGPS
jgi:hypothetical protein